MNIILPVIYYAQRFWDKIIEPNISDLLIKSIMSFENKTLFSFESDVKKILNSCQDQDFIDEHHYVISNVLKEEEMSKIYFGYIYDLLVKYCKNNKISLILKEDKNTFELIW